MALSSLPSQATDTVRLVQRGGPYPYPQDNQTFHSREGVLPACSTGYYKEHTVKTPGASTRGARRIVTGDATRSRTSPRPTTTRASSWWTSPVSRTRPADLPAATRSAGHTRTGTAVGARSVTCTGCSRPSTSWSRSSRKRVACR
ncbi:ribonuclease domain-containing protein [Actinosynnema sp. NPDC091369]